MIEAGSGRNRGDPARGQIHGRIARRPGPRLCLRKLRPAVAAARTGADRRQRARQPARLSDPGRGLRGPRRAVRDRRQIRRQSMGRGTRPFAIRRRRLARQLRALQIRSGAVQHLGLGQLRPSRPVDLHGADRTLGGARRRQLRLCDLSAALAGGRAHLSPAVVPPERHERIHGPHSRGLRRQGRRLSAGRHVACTIAWPRTAPTSRPTSARAPPS